MRDDSGTSQAVRGADLLARTLAAEGAGLVFGVPGESFLAFLDAVLAEPALRFVTARHEGGAAFMAEAHGKLTGRPGICFVTRGPGAMNAAIGLHVAQQDSTPMILFVGQVARGMRGREAFQEVDHARHFADIAKWSAEIDDPARIPEFVGRAFHTAMAGRPGPVVLALPEDVLSAVSEAPAAVPAAPATVARPGPLPDDVAALTARLGRAARPLVIAGGGAWSAATAAALTDWADREALPVVAEFRCQDYCDNAHPNYAGVAGLGIAADLAERIRDSDCLILVGARMGEVPSAGYRLIEVPQPRQALVHVHPAGEELGRVYRPQLGIHAAPEPFLRAMLAAPASGGAAMRQRWVAECRAAFEAAQAALRPAPGPVDPGVVLRHLAERLPDAIVTNGAGNFAGWLHRVWPYRRYRSQLAPVAGAMGYGVPAAVAAALAAPGRPVIAVAGDGDFLMTGQELATAVAHRLPVLFLVVNNAMLGTIRMHQETHYPGRISATDLTNPDFAAYARAFGAHGALVERTADFPAALDAALAADGPALIELRVSPEALSVNRTLAETRRGGTPAGP